MKPLTNKQTARLWANDISSCSKCTISLFCNHKVTHYIFSPKPLRTIDLMLIGEAPGESEYLNKEPFIGPSGTCLRELLDDAVSDDISFCITNSILCTPFNDQSRYSIRAPLLSEVKECSTHLATLVKKLKPKYMVALGQVATKAINLLIKINVPVPPYITILHPSKIIQSTDYHYQFERASLAIKEYLQK